MKRVWYRYEEWEDYQAGMWRLLWKHEEAGFVKKAIEFTGDAELYGLFMMEVIKEWPVSCKYNFTCDHLNKHAWVGHAACCMATESPEYITRLAWRELTERQQIDANKQATIAIETWQKENSELIF